MKQAHTFHPTILREYDIRGVVGDTLSATDALMIGRAFGTMIRRRNGRRVALGYDGRHSSPELAEAVAKGLAASGLEVLRVGLGPTPMTYFAVYELEADGGIVVTGSHNPPEFNGFKMMLGHQAVYGEAIEEIGRLAAAGDFESGEGRITDTPLLDDYVARLIRDYDGTREMSVVWDAGNGAAGEAVRKLAKALPGRHMLLYDEIDGDFPNHHPDPTVAENLKDIIATVRGTGADLGIALDGDGDRIGVVDNEGRILYGDQILALLARDILKDHPGGTVIADVKASQMVFDEIARAGGTPLMWKTGHSLIKAKMAEVGGPVGGEMSGHIFIADRFYGFDDALYAGIRFMAMASRNDGPVSGLLDSLPKMINTPELRFPCPDERKFAVIDEVRDALANVAGIDVNDIDGVRVTTPDGWWLLRASNTQPVLVARCESRSADGLERLKAALVDALKPTGVSPPEFA